MEDELHLKLKCPKRSNLRMKFIKKCYYIDASVFNLIQLLCLYKMSK